MQVTSASRRGSQGGTGIPERSEDMPGKSLNEGTDTRNDTQPLQRISTRFCLGNSKTDAQSHRKPKNPVSLLGAQFLPVKSKGRKMNCLLTKTIGKPAAHREKLKGAKAIGSNVTCGVDTLLLLASVL